MATEPARWHFTVGDYHQMAEAGILQEDDRVELIDGEIVKMSPIGGRHAWCVTRLNQLLSHLIRSDAIVHIQNPVRLGEYDEPQPDVAVVRPRNYGDELPRADDVLFLIEVSDTTLSYDRRQKLPLYARAGIGECWLVDLQGEMIERHTDPLGAQYRVRVRAGRGDEIESLAIPGLVLKADEILG